MFFLATDLDDVASIIYDMEAEGINHDQFFVIYRSEVDLRRRFLHGGNTLDNTRIVAASSRSNIFATIGLAIYVLIALIALPFSQILSPTVGVISLMVFVFVKLAVLVGGGMYDDYFKGVFNSYLDYGNCLVVVDSKAKQQKFIIDLFNRFPSVCLLVDASNFASPLPMKKYIRRSLPKLVK